MAGRWIFDDNRPKSHGVRPPEPEPEPENLRLSTDARQAAKLMKEIRLRFANSWRQDDNFLEKFFPINPSWLASIQAAKRKHYNARSSRWKGIGIAPKAASILYTPLRMLMTFILLAEERSRPQPSSGYVAVGQNNPERESSYRDMYWCTRHVRGVLSTHGKNKRVRTASRSPVSPALYLVGAAAEIMGVTSSLLRADNFTGIAPIEIILDSEDYGLARDRLAAKISEMFACQPDRRFVWDEGDIMICYSMISSRSFFLIYKI
ncbi:hypothetical protein JB92DRAFT_3129734 [Gautieria morchelliformis]|nr:hypothetical protein JB92DRAFT_3129734 [Gautieria morchelliformis]